MDAPVRMVDRSARPSVDAVKAWIGARNAKRWDTLSHFIDEQYPGVFDVEWLYGGQKYGWGLRYKKSKSFCTFIPERGHFKVQVVFGAAERARAASLLPTLGSHVRHDLEASRTYHDGTWLFVDVDSQAVVEDLERLLMLKRAPGRGRGRGQPKPNG